MDGTIGYLSAKTYKKLVLQISSKVTTDSYTKLTFPTFIVNLQTLYYLFENKKLSCDQINPLNYELQI